MRFGLTIFPTDETPGPARLAEIAEAEGFDSLWFPEHTHIPAARATPYPLSDDGGLPREYSRLLDPLVACAAAAAVTTTLRVGTAVVLVPQHDPIVLAKATASVDHLSGGRFEFGVGAGWNEEEARNHGVPFERRFGVLREYVEAIRAIWTADEATYAGTHVSFERIWSWPKPVQEPGPPVLLGGNGPKVLDRVLRYGDAWIPNLERDDEVLLRRVAELRERAGRPVPVMINAAPARPERLARYAEAGIDRCVFYLPQGDETAIRERIARIIVARAAVS